MDPASVPVHGVRLGRAATFAFGAAVAGSMGVAGCGDDSTPATDAGRDSGSVTVDSGGGTDAGTTDSGVDAGQDAGGMMTLYGVPPPVDAGPDDAGGTMNLYGLPPLDAG